MQIGQDCHIILQHPNVNGGIGVGFLLEQTKTQRYEIRLKREAYQTPSGLWADRVKISFALELNDTNIAQNGSNLPLTLAQCYECLKDFLNQRTGLKLITEHDEYNDLHASLLCAEEFHFPSKIRLVIKLNNGGYPERVPIDLAAMGASAYDNGITYGTAVWN